MELKRSDGKRVRIEINLYSDRYRGEMEYTTLVTYCLPRKRIWQDVYSTDDYLYRRLDSKGRIEFIKQAQLEHVTKEEIYAAKVEYWNSIKPKPSPEILQEVKQEKISGYRG
jgi:hypothetical protein